MATTFKMYTAASSTPAMEFPGAWDVEANMNFASVLTASCSYDWWTHAQETLGPNPWQLRVFVEIVDEGQTCFAGYIEHVERQHPTVEITAKDKLGIVGETLCRYETADNNLWNIWAAWSGSENVGTDGSPIRLYPSAYAATTAPYNIWYPKYDSAAWKTAGSDLEVTLTAGFTSGDGTIDIGTSDDAAAAPPEGFCSITHGGSVNMIQYRGKAWDEVNSTYKIYNCNHGRNGSTATDGSIGEVLYFRFAKRIHFDRTPRVRGFVTSGSVYEVINPELYDVLIAEGGFGFKTDPLNLRRKTGGASDAFDEIRAVYNVYAEEDNTKYLRLDALLSQICAVHAADFGPGIAFDIAISPDIVLTRVECPRSTYLLDFIRQLLSDIGLLKGNENDAIGIWYDAATNTVCIKSVAQLADTDASCIRYTGEKTIASAASMENVYSAIACDYLDQNSGNLLASRRVWHDVGGTGGGTAPYVFHLNGGTYQQTGAAYGGTNSSMNLLYPNNTRLITLMTAAGDGLPELIMDGNSDTGFALAWDNSSDATNAIIYFWFAGANEYTPDSRWIGEVGMLLDMESSASGGNSPRFEVYYFDDLVPSNDSGGSASEPTTTNGLQYLDSRLSLEYSGGVIKETNRVLSADGMRTYGNGIAIKLLSPLRFTIDSTDYYGIKLKDIWCKPPPLDSTIFALAASFSTGATNYLTAPDSYDKITGYLGTHRVGLLNVGNVSKSAADYFAFLQILQGLVLTATQTVDVTDKTSMQWHGFPTLGKTAVLTDAADPRAKFSGVVDAFRIGRRAGVRYIQGLRAIDFNAGIFGDRV